MGRRSKGETAIPYAPFERILRQEGAYRVSEDAVRRLHDFIEKISRELARESIELASHAGRRTVTGVDIEMAVKRFLKRFTVPF